MADTHVETGALSFSLTRIFDAPPELVYRAWADPEMLAAWWGPLPTPSTITHDLREGGAYLWVMHNPNGEEYPMAGHFTEVHENLVLEFTSNIEGHGPAWHQKMADLYHASGGAEGTQPSLELVTRVVFEPYPGNRTRQVVTQTYRTAAERDAFMKMGAAGGWGMSFDKLDGLLASRT